MTKSPTLIQSLAAALKDAAKVNGSVQVKPATVLWTDAEAQWTTVFERLYAEGVGVVQLGEFEPELRRGPAIWLKCVVAGLIPELTGNQSSTVLHLPGVS